MKLVHTSCVRNYAHVGLVHKRQCATHKGFRVRQKFGFQLHELHFRVHGGNGGLERNETVHNVHNESGRVGWFLISISETISIFFVGK